MGDLTKYLQHDLVLYFVNLPVILPVNMMRMHKPNATPEKIMIPVSLAPLSLGSWLADILTK